MKVFPMKFKLLGKSGLRVSEICLGTMTFGEEFGWGSPKSESQKVFDLYASSGGNFLDTANYYTKGTSETFLGKLLKGRRDEFVVATKYSLTQNPKDPNASGNHRKHLVTAVEASLKRLQTDYIDVYWIHAWDKLTPVEEIMQNYFTQYKEANLKFWRKIEMFIWSDLGSETVKKYQYVVKLDYRSSSQSRPDTIRVFACGKIDKGENCGMWWVSSRDLWEQGFDQG